MNNINNKLPRTIEVGLSIKLIEYLRRIGIIDDGMHSFCVNKLLKKQE